MDKAGKINHIFKLVGILFILLAFTVFAQAVTFDLTCNDQLNCSVKSYCSDSGILALQQAWSSSSYNISSSSIGEHTCNATVRVTAFGKGGDSQHQNNEVTDVFLNGVKIGTTRDNYANTGDPIDYTFCGFESQTLGTATVNLSQNNTVTLTTDDSHGIISVTLNCTPTGRPTCEESATPRIDDIDDEQISYNDNFELDLWNYVSDADSRLSDLKYTVSVNNTIVDCQVDNNRYLQCNSDLDLGTSTVTLIVEDSCKKKATKTFDIEVVNLPPTININDQEASCVSDFDKFLDLRDYSFDEDEDLADYNINIQTNPSLISCIIEDDFYLTCVVNSCSEDFTELNISITDIFGERDDTNFILELKNFPPTLEEDLPDTCLSNDDDEIIDLRDYFDDLEDGVNLEYSVDQNTYKNVDCTISNDYFLSCEMKTNAFTPTLLTITAEDDEGESIDANMLLKTNCSSDPNGRNKIIFSAPQVGICLEKCTSYTTQIEVTNNTNEDKYFDLELDYEDHFEVSLGKNKFTLAPGQTTFVPLEALTCTNDADTYEVIVSDYDNDLELTFDYEVGTCDNFDGFRIDEYENEVCQGSVAEYTVDVENTSGEEKIIYLLAENQMLLPYFSKERVILDDDEEMSVQVIVDAKHAPLGKYNVFLSGDADNYHIEKRLVVEVVDCSNFKERNLLIETSDICLDVERGETVESSFSIRRLVEGCSGCRFDLLGVDLLMFGAPYELSHDTVYLEGNEEKVIDYTLYVPENMSTGIHLIEVVGNELLQGVFDDETGFVETETICINVAGQSKSQVKLLTGIKDIVWCGSEIFELEIINSGDFDETFDLTALNLPKGVKVFFSEDEVTVKAGETKIIYVSIATDHDSIIADNQSVTVKLDGTVSMSTEIYFNIKGKAAQADLEFLSASELLTVNAFESTTYELIIRNNSDRAYNNVELRFENVPYGVEVEGKLIDSIAPGEVITLRGDIAAGDLNGLFEPAFVLESITFLNKKEFGLYIKNNKPFLGGFISEELDNVSGGNSATGLFSLAGINFGLGLGVFLLLLLFALILGVIFTHESSREEVWVEVSK